MKAKTTRTPQGQSTDTVALAPGTQLLGEYRGGGYDDRPHLLQRADGQMVQVSHLVYLVAEHLDGVRDFNQIAVAVTERYGREVDAGDVSVLVDRLLRPLGILAAGPAATAATEPRGDAPLPKAKPILGLRARVGVVPESLHRVVTSALRVMFTPVIVATTLLAFVALDALLALSYRHEIVEGGRQVVLHPQLLLLISVMTWASMVFHELGHAAALRYSGGTPGSLGVGVYLVWPVLSTDVTDAYRLDRRGRIRTDLGGVYFNAVFIIVATTVFLATGYEPLLVFVALSHLQTLQQFLPFVRLDGYYVVGDVVGVPNLFSYMSPIVTRLTRRSDAQARQAADLRLARLKPWPRRVIVAWVLFTIPVLTVNAVTLAFLAPRLLGAGVGSGRLQWQTLTAALDRSAYATALSALTGLVVLAAPVAGTGVVVFLLGRRALRGLVRSRNPLVIATVVAVLVAVVGLALPSWEDRFDAARQRFDTSTEQPAPTAPAPEPLSGRGSVDLTPPADQSPAVTPPPATEPPPPTVAPPANRNAPPDCGPESSHRADGRALWMQELRCAA